MAAEEDAAYPCELGLHDLEWHQLRRISGLVELSADRTTAVCHAPMHSSNRICTAPLESGTTWSVMLEHFRDASSIYCGVASEDARWWGLCSDGYGLYRDGFALATGPESVWQVEAVPGEEWVFKYQQQEDSELYELLLTRARRGVTVTPVHVAFHNLPAGLCAYVDVNIEGDTIVFEPNVPFPDVEPQEDDAIDNVEAQEEHQFARPEVHLKGLEWFQLRRVHGEVELSDDRQMAICHAAIYSGNKVRTAPMTSATSWCITFEHFRPNSSIYCGVTSEDDTQWWSLCSDAYGLYRHGNSAESLPGTDFKQQAHIGEKWFYTYEQRDDLDAYEMRIRRELDGEVIVPEQVAFDNLPPNLCAFIDVNIDGDRVTIEFDLLPPK